MMIKTGTTPFWIDTDHVITVWPNPSSDHPAGYDWEIRLSSGDKWQVTNEIGVAILEAKLKSSPTRVELAQTIYSELIRAGKVDTAEMVNAVDWAFQAADRFIALANPQTTSEVS